MRRPNGGACARRNAQKCKWGTAPAPGTQPRSRGVTDRRVRGELTPGRGAPWSEARGAREGIIHTEELRCQDGYVRGGLLGLILSIVWSIVFLFEISITWAIAHCFFGIIYGVIADFVASSWSTRASSH